MRVRTKGPADRAESTITVADQGVAAAGWTGDDDLTDTRSDAALVAAVRDGDQQAFAALYERHAPAARAVARRYSNSAVDAEDAVADGFARILAAVRAGNGPDAAFRAYLFTVVRRVALHRIEAGRRVEPTDDVAALESGGIPAEASDEPAMAGFERDVVAQAYRSLPERWQSVLWYTEVEGLSPAQIAPALGIPANAVAVLAYRAREGLRQAYLQKHVAVPAGEGCARIVPKLGAYVRGTAAARDTAAVSAHLAECEACRGLVLELGEVSHAMRVVIAPLVLGAAAVTAVQGIGFGGAAAALGGSAAAGAAAAAGSSVGLGAGAAAAPVAGAASGTSLAVAGAAGTGAVGTGAVGAGAVGAAAGGSALGWSSLAAGGSAVAVKLGATGALVVAAVGVVPALTPVLPDSVTRAGSVLSVLAPESDDRSVLPEDGDAGGSADTGATTDRPWTDPAAVVLPDLGGSGVTDPVDGAPGTRATDGDLPAPSSVLLPGEPAPGAELPGLGNGRGDAGQDGPSATRSSGDAGPGRAGGGRPAGGGSSSGPGAPRTEVPRGNGPPGVDGPPGHVGGEIGVPPGNGPTGEGPPGHVGGVPGVPAGPGASDGVPHGNGPDGNGPPGHVDVGVPPVVGAPPVDVPRGQGPNGEGPPGHPVTGEPPAVVDPGTASAPHGRGPNGEGPPGHLAP